MGYGQGMGGRTEGLVKDANGARKYTGVVLSCLKFVLKKEF